MIKLYRVKCKTSIFYMEQPLITFDVSWVLKRGLDVPTPIPLEQIVEGYTDSDHSSLGDLDELRKPVTQRRAANELLTLAEALLFKGFLEQQGHTEVSIFEAGLPLSEDVKPISYGWEVRWASYKFSQDDLVLEAEGYPVTSPPVEVTLEMRERVIRTFGKEEGENCLLGVEYLHRALSERNILLFNPQVVKAYPDEVISYLTNFAILEREKGWVIDSFTVDYLLQALRLGYQPGQAFEKVLSVARRLYHDGFQVKRAKLNVT